MGMFYFQVNLIRDDNRMVMVIQNQSPAEVWENIDDIVE